MLYDELADPESVTPDDLLKRYESELSAVIASVGADEIVEAAGVDSDVVSALVDGGASDVKLADAAAILATTDGAETAESILLETRDHLLLLMTTAVRDVESVAADVDVDLSPTQIQQKIEGRAPMTLAEYAHVHRYLAVEADW